LSGRCSYPFWRCRERVHLHTYIHTHIHTPYMQQQLVYCLCCWGGSFVFVFVCVFVCVFVFVPCRARCRLLSEAEPNECRGYLHLAAGTVPNRRFIPPCITQGGLVHRRERGRKRMLPNGRSCPIPTGMGVAGLVGSVRLPLADPGLQRFVKAHTPGLLTETGWRILRRWLP